MESKMEFARRPVKGNPKGEEVNLISNLVQMRFNPDANYAKQFSIKFNPEIAGDNYPLRKLVLRSVAKDLKDKYNPCLTTGNTFFTSTPNALKSIDITTRVQDVDYTITIEETQNYVNLEMIRTATPETIKVKSFVEILLRNIIEANNGLLRFDNNSVYDYTQKKAIGSVSIMPGFATSAIISQRGLLMKITPKNKLLTGISAGRKLRELQDKFRNGALRPAIEEYFIGRSVLAKYGSFRVYKISGVSFDKNSKNTRIDYKARNDEEPPKNITLCEYYQLHHNITIKDPTQFLLIHNPKRRDINEMVEIYLIPELCEICGMDEEMMRNEPDLLKRAGVRMTPSQKMGKIKDIKKLLTNPLKQQTQNTLKKSPNEITNEWGLQFNDNFLHVNGRVLPNPSIQFRVEEGKIIGGKFSYRRCLKPNGGFLKNDWVCITTRANIAQDMVSSLIKSSKQIDIPIETPYIFQLGGNTISDWIEDMNNHVDELFVGKKLVLAIIDDKNKHYKNLKNYFLNQVRIPSQFALTSKRTQSLSYFANVLNQMTVKIGGELFNIPQMRNDQNRTMIVGIDSTKGKTARKYTMTSSYNPYMSKYYTQQISSQSLEEALTVLIGKAWNFFKRVSTLYPQYIIIYRAGGNDKQNERLFKEEIPIIQRMLRDLSSVNENISVKFCYITVNMKTDVKFFKDECNAYSNPVSGTVIDTDVVHPDYFDFYLQPQFVSDKCGATATPVHYHCMYDEIGLPLEVLENLTYWQTYYYWNWSGAIRVPAALKYAEVCNSFSSNHSINIEDLDEKLKENLYYI